MATWKKVLVSGSAAALASLTLDSPLAVSSGGTGGTSLNGSGTVLGTTGATGVSMTGSFTGSFTGDGSGLTGLLTLPVNGWELGTQTTGSYLAGLASGSNITITTPTGEGVTPVISVVASPTFTDVTVQGNLTVSGTVTTINTTNTAVSDQFILLASGSTSTIDAGILVNNGSNVGEAFYWENNVAGTGRWAVASGIDPTATTVTAAEYVTTTKLGTAVPSAAPTYGGATNGVGNIYVKTDTSDIYIYA